MNTFPMKVFLKSIVLTAQEQINTNGLFIINNVIKKSNSVEYSGSISQGIVSVASLNKVLWYDIY